MSLSVIPEEPSGFQESDLEYLGRMPRSSRRPHTYSGRREQARGRYGSPTGRYIRAAAGRSLGGLRPNSHSYFPNDPGPASRRRSPEARVTGFARNPRHPKSLYDAEISLRHFMKGDPKVTSDMAFPDPKNRGFRNPMAPRFHHEFDLTRDDYDIKTNPLAGVDMDVLMSGPSMAGTYVNRGYDDTADDGFDSNEQSTSEELSERGAGGEDEIEDDVGVDDSVSRRAEENPRAIYSSVNKYRLPPRQSADLTHSEPPAFAPRPPPPPEQPPLIPRAVANQDEPESYQVQEIQEESKGVQTQPMEPLHTLAEEDEDQQQIEQLEIDETQEIEEPQIDLRDMSTQTNVTVQELSEPVEQDEGETEDRFIQIREGREDNSTMTHDNWEAVAPWSQRSNQPVERSDSLAVNYRRVVAELSGAERPPPPPPLDEPPRRHEIQRRHTHERPRSRDDPPPWSPPIEPQVEQILRPLPMEEDMRNYPPPSREWDPPSRRYYHGNRISAADFCNRFCLITLILLAVGIIAGIIVVTVLYVSSSNCNGDPCNLIQEPGFLAGFVLLGAFAILTVFALLTWCCYNMTKRQRNLHKYRPRDRQMHWEGGY